MLDRLKTGLLLLTLVNTGCAHQGVNVSMLRDLQKHFSSRWIILQTCSKTSLESNPMLSLLLAMTNYPEVFISVYDWRDFNSTSMDRYYAKRPMVLISCWACVDDCFLQMNNLNENNIISRFVWILPPDITPDMRHLYIPVNCQFIHWTKMWNNEYILTEMYRTSAESLMYTNQFGTWSKMQGLNTSAVSFLQRRSNFFSQSLVLMIQQHRFNFTGFPYPNEDDEIDIFMAIMARLNATATIKRELPGDFDFYLTLDLLSQENVKLMLNPIVKERMAIFFKDIASEFTWNSYLMPFDHDLWLVLLAWALLTAVFLFGVAKLYDCNDKQVQLNEYVFQSFAILFQQYETPRENYFSFRLIAFTHWGFSIMILSSYSAIFISFITILVMKPPFSTIQDVLHDSSYNVVTAPELGIVEILKADPELNELYRKRLDPFSPRITNFLEGFHEVCYGKRKLISITSVFFMGFIRQILNDCPISKTYVHINAVLISWPGKPHSPYKDEINYCITKLTERGVFMNFMGKKSGGFKRPKPEPTFDSIRLDQVLFIYMALSAGILLSFFFLMLEIRFAR